MRRISLYLEEDDTGLNVKVSISRQDLNKFLELIQQWQSDRAPLREEQSQLGGWRQQWAMAHGDSWGQPLIAADGAEESNGSLLMCIW